MLLQACRECRNFFVVASERGKFEINNENLFGLENTPPIGFHILIERAGKGVDGSLFNSGLFPITDEFPRLAGVTNESWEGCIHVCAIPKDFLALADEIAAHIANAPLGGYTHESFGAHSYSLATNARGVPAAWNEVYAERLKPYRKMFLEVRV